MTRITYQVEWEQEGTRESRPHESRSTRGGWRTRGHSGDLTAVLGRASGWIIFLDRGSESTNSCVLCLITVCYTVKFCAHFFVWITFHKKTQRMQEWRPIEFSQCGSIQSAKTRPRADCGSDHELLITKFRLKLKKVGKTTRPFRYDLNQIPYDYTVKGRNRFKGLDLIDRVPDELWNDVRDIVQETGIKTITIEKKCKKVKWLSGEALQITVKRREAKSKGEKER